MTTTVVRARIRQMAVAEGTLYGPVASAHQGVINFVNYNHTHSSAITVGLEIDIAGSGSDNVKLLSAWSVDPNVPFLFNGVIGLEVGDIVRILTSNTSGVLDVYTTVLDIT